MTQDEVIFRLKSIIHGNQHYTTWTVSTPHLVQLVNSAIEMEREACAKLCDEARAGRLAEQIRARGQA